MLDELKLPLNQASAGFPDHPHRCAGSGLGWRLTQNTLDCTSCIMQLTGVVPARVLQGL
jgi:hypothetical protein